MIKTKDIKERIESDFGDSAFEVYKTFEDAFAKAEYLNHPRIIRCILFLTNKDLGKLKGNIEIATYDPRDIMLNAEYLYLGQDEQPRRVRDFNKTFDQAEENVQE